MSTKRIDPAVRPTWEEFWAEGGRTGGPIENKRWLAARALIELSPGVQSTAEYFISWDEEMLGMAIDWDDWVAYCDANADEIGFSEPDRRLFLLVAALVIKRRTIDPDILRWAGRWEPELWRILTDWGTDGRIEAIPTQQLRAA